MVLRLNARRVMPGARRKGESFIPNQERTTVCYLKSDQNAAALFNCGIINCGIRTPPPAVIFSRMGAALVSGVRVLMRG
jgi:hypothetical protein